MASTIGCPRELVKGMGCPAARSEPRRNLVAARRLLGHMFERTKRSIAGPRKPGGPRTIRTIWSRIADGWRPWHTVVVLCLLFVTMAGVGGAKAAWDRICLEGRCPSIAQITVWEPEESSKVYASDGSLIREFFKERRTVVELGDLPPYVAHSFVSIED